MILTDLIDYYANLLAYQYRNRPNASNTVKLLTKQAVADLFVQDLLTCFGIDTAVGTQLDILGKYVGASRNIGSVITRPYFGLWEYTSTLNAALYKGTWNPISNDPALPAAGGGNNGWWYVISDAGTSAAPIVATWQPGDVIFSNGVVWAKTSVNNGNGFTDYTNLAINRNAVFYDYVFASNQNSDLTDAEYRTVIKLKIILNASDGTLKTIMDYLQTFFPGEITLIDGANMHMTYTVLSTVAMSQELLELYLPRPMGVGITVTIVTPVPSGGDLLTTEGGFVLMAEDGSPLTT